MKQIENNRVNAVVALTMMVLGLLVMMIGFHYQTIYLSFKGHQMNMIAENQRIVLNENRTELLHLNRCLMHLDIRL